MTGAAYDIYIVAHVDELRDERDRLRERVRDLVHENALLEAEVDKLRHRRRDEDWSWMNG